MFCAHCGEKLIDSGQRFCQNCGTELLTTSKPTDYRPEKIQYPTTPKVYYPPVKPQTHLQRGPPGKYSKLCLWMALLSIFIGIVSLIIGYNYYRFTYIVYYNNIVRLIVGVAILLSRVGGLILGVFSKINGSKAEIFEPYNDTEKAGSIFAVFGIILNAIGLFLSFFGPWTIFIPLYM